MKKITTKSKKKKSSKKKKRDIVLAVLENENVEKVEKDIIISLINYKNNEPWSGQAYTPPCSIFEKIVEKFQEHTDVDLANPFFISMQLISGILLKKGIKISVAGNKEEPTIWLNVLCNSGSSKSFCLNKLKNSLQKGIVFEKKIIEVQQNSDEFSFTEDDAKLAAEYEKIWAEYEKLNPKIEQKIEFTADDLIWETGAVSTAQFMREWAGHENKKGEIIEEEHNNRVLIVDEATDFFEQLKDPKGILYPMYKNFLMAYSHEKIVYATANNGKIEIERPAISFLGLATPERFVGNITEKDIEGGFYYRFATVISEESRSMKGHAIYPNNFLEGIEENWRELIDSLVHDTYTVSDKALEFFKENFDVLVENSSLPAAYLRRTTWLQHKIALVYHIALGKGTEQEIGVEAYSWAKRLMSVFSDSAAKIIHEKMNTESVQMIEKVEALIARRAEKGLKTTARDIVLNTKIATKEAELYLRIVEKG